MKKGIIQEIKKSELKQKLFHEHYCSDRHEGIANWCVTSIDNVEDKKELRKKELYWINKLNIWTPVVMSERCTKHTKYERVVRHFLQINRNDENVYYFMIKFIFVIFLYLFILLLISLILSLFLSLL